MSKKLFIRGTLLLTFSGLLSRLAGFFYRIFLSHTIGAQGLGIFQLTVPLQLLFMSLCASGIQTGISRLTASAKAQNHSHQKGDYFVCGAVFSVVLSVILACQLCFFGDFWAKEILKELTSGKTDDKETFANISPRNNEDDMQLNLLDTASNAVTDKLKSVDVNTLTPIEAMNLLYELKNMI